MSTNGSDMPVILSFALTPREWAAVAASLMMVRETISALEEVTGRKSSDKVLEATATSDRFSGMIRDEMKRLG